MKKDIIGVIVSIVLSVAIVMGIPYLLDENKVEGESFSIESLVNQNAVLGNDVNTYNYLYYQGKLVGVITSLDTFYSEINNEYQKYVDKFPNTSLGLSEDLVLTKEKTFNKYENKDDEIVSYLIDNDLLGVKTTAIEFSTSEGVYDVIYVSDLEMFYEARDTFLKNFVSDETFQKIAKGETIAEPVDFGSVDMNVKIEETITYSSSFMAPDNIFTTFDEIYDYLCYGRNSEKQYYITKEGDTLRGIGYRFKNMSPKQLMLINRDIIFSTDQVLTPGMNINVTYFSSPINVVVFKDRLASEVVTPESPIYVKDATLESGTTIIETEESNGLKNVLYQETWVNGVLQTGSVKSSNVVRQPIQGVIKVGTARKADVGTGNYVWPVDNPKITCGWGCYYIPGIGSHMGTDFVNQYERYGNVYAADTGIVETASYNGIDGNFVVIDHQNGYKTHYGHMSKIIVSAGQVVSRGEQIGVMGSTGYAFGVHTHFHFIVDGHLTDACTIMDCTQVPWS